MPLKSALNNANNDGAEDDADADGSEDDADAEGSKDDADDDNVECDGDSEYTWKRAGIQKGDVVLMNAGDDSERWLGEVSDLLEMVYDKDAKGQLGDVVLHEYGAKYHTTCGSWDRVWLPQYTKGALSPD